MVRLVICEPLRKPLPLLNEHLARHNRVQVVGYAYDGVEAAQLALTAQPDVLLVTEEVAGLSGLELTRLVGEVAPQVPVALITEQAGLEGLQQAMNHGARAVFPPGEQVSRVVETLERLTALGRPRPGSDRARVTDPRFLPSTLVAVGATGGVGTTTVVSNLAVLLAQAQPDQVVLVDWHLQVSDLAAGLGLRPSHGIADFAVYGSEIDQEVLSKCLLRHDCGLQVLAGSVKPTQAWLEPLPRAFAAQLLGLLRRRFTWVLFDLPPVWGPAELYLCTHAQELVLVATPGSAGALRAAGMVADLLRAQQARPDHLRLVVNRAERSAPYRAEDLAQLTGLPVVTEIPEDPTVPRQAGGGEVLALSARRGPAALALVALGQTAAGWRPQGPAGSPAAAAAPAQPQEVDA